MLQLGAEQSLSSVDLHSRKHFMLYQVLGKKRFRYNTSRVLIHVCTLNIRKNRIGLGVDHKLFSEPREACFPRIPSKSPRVKEMWPSPRAISHPKPIPNRCKSNLCYRPPLSANSVLLPKAAKGFIFFTLGSFSSYLN